MNKKALKIVKYLLITLFVSYYSSSTLFFHTHDFEWGTVTHSHPYMPGAMHSHTAADCQTIQLLTTLLLTTVGGVAIAVVAMVVRHLLYAPHFISLARHIVANCSLRAPPVPIY